MRDRLPSTEYAIHLMYDRPDIDERDRRRLWLSRYIEDMGHPPADIGRTWYYLRHRYGPPLPRKPRYARPLPSPHRTPVEQPTRGPGRPLAESPTARHACLIVLVDRLSTAGGLVLNLATAHTLIGDAMLSMLYPITLSAQAQAAGTSVHRLKLPRGATYLGASVGLEALTGSPTNVKFTVKNGSTVLTADTALTLTAAGTVNAVTPDLGGSATPAALAAGDTVTVDVAFTAGSTPTADYDIALWFLGGTV